MSYQVAAKKAKRTLDSAVIERRASVRHVCDLEAVSRPLESPVGLCWGARVRSVSLGGMSLVLCYPFKPGAFLAVEMNRQEQAANHMVKVVHVADQSDGTWLLGCEFVKPLNDAELKALN
jgi:hypothetical protein